jgi:signal transduction histidine kinase
VSRTFVERWRGAAADAKVQPVDTVVAQRFEGPAVSVQTPPSRRHLIAEAVASGSFCAAAAGCVAWAPGSDAWPDWWVAASFVALMAVAFRVRFSVGSYDALPTQLVFVPMLFGLPLGWVPALVAGSFLLARLPDYATGARSPARAVMVPADGWYTLGPVVVLGLAGAGAPDWGDWPVLVLALAAQLAVDIVVTMARGAAGLGIRPSIRSDVDGWVLLVDTLLSPIGFLAAIASQQAPLAFLAVAPLGALLVVFAREREGRIEQALETARVSQRLVETERTAAREREELIAGASHELQTPLAVVLGLAGALERDPAMAPERRAEAYGVLGREARRMGFLVRGFLDYTRLKAGRDLEVLTRPVAVADAVQPVLDALAGQGEIAFEQAGELPAVTVDRDRLGLAVHHVVVNALRHGAAPVRLSAARAGARVALSIEDSGAGIPAAERATVFDEFARGSGATGTEGAGLGLYVAREVLAAQGASIEAGEAPGGGARFVISLPAAPG